MTQDMIELSIKPLHPPLPPPTHNCIHCGGDIPRKRIDDPPKKNYCKNTCRQQHFRLWRIENGICIKCGRNKSTRTSQTCAPCVKIISDKQKAERRQIQEKKHADKLAIDPNYLDKKPFGTSDHHITEEFYVYQQKTAKHSRMEPISPPPKWAVRNGDLDDFEFPDPRDDDGNPIEQVAVSHRPRTVRELYKSGVSLRKQMYQWMGVYEPKVFLD